MLAYQQRTVPCLGAPFASTRGGRSQRGSGPETAVSPLPSRGGPGAAGLVLCFLLVEDVSVGRLPSRPDQLLGARRHTGPISAESGLRLVPLVVVALSMSC